MPTYDYNCENCGHVFEEFLSMSKCDKPISDPCPKCGQKKVKKMVSSFAICDPVTLGLKKPDRGFRDVLSKVREKHPKNTMADRW